MKKALLFLFCLAPVFGQEGANPLRFVAAEIPGWSYDTRWKQLFGSDIQIYVNLDPASKKPKSVEIAFEKKNRLFHLALLPNQRKDLLQALKKYKEWHQSATESAQELDKEIVEIQADFLFWKAKKGSENSMAQPYAFSARFFSQNAKRHQFVLWFPKAQSTDGVSVASDIPALYFDYEEALNMEQILSDAGLTAAAKKEDLKRKNPDIIIE